MTIQQLVDMGLSEDLAKSVFETHMDSIKNKFVPLERFNEVNEAKQQAKEQLATQLKERDEAINSLKKSLEDAPSITLVTELQDKLTQKDKEYELKLQAEIKKNKVLSSIGADCHDSDLVIGLLNLDNVTIGQNNELSGLSEQVNVLKEQKPFLFKKAQEPLTSGQITVQQPIKNTIVTPNNNIAQSTQTSSDDKVKQRVDEIVKQMVARQAINQTFNKGE